MLKSTLIAYLNDYLKISAIHDDSQNGLQVDNDKKEIKKIGYAVDASNYLIERAVKEKVDMLIVHHGLFRGKEAPVIGLLYQRLKRLIRNDICLYAAHLPLDAHPEVGNNAGLIQAFVDFFKIKKYKIHDFGIYAGQAIGFGLKFSEKIPFAKLKSFLTHMGFEEKIFNFNNKKEITSLAVMSGGGGSVVPEASLSGYDVLLVGEAKHSEHMRAKEFGLSLMTGGHYETETIGVTLLAKHLEKKFKLKTVFLDEKY